MKHCRSLPLPLSMVAVVVLAGAALMARAAAPTPQAQAQAAFAAGYHDFEHGDFNAAVPKLESATADSSGLADYALYYLGRAQLQRHNFDAAQASFARLTADYPQSLLAPSSEIALAKIALTANHPQQARQCALAALDMSDSVPVQAPARLTLGRALTAMGQPQAAYEQFQTVRRNYPHSPFDAAARILRQALLQARPEVVDTSSLAYLSAEARLLLREGQAHDAYTTAREALALQPPASVRAAMFWVQAKASRGQPDRAEAAFQSYLAVAPHGAKAPNALYDLALIDWHRKDTAGARQYFRRIVTNFSGSGLVPAAMLRIGRTYEDEHRFDAARSAYLQLAAAHPSSASAADARFRSVWLLYMHHNFAAAAKGFEAQEAHAADAKERAMYQYWQARALAQTGQQAAAREIFSDLAASTVTNYYPELASRRVGAPPIVLPAVALDPPFISPAGTSAAIAYHLRRALTLKMLALFRLELGELRRLRALSADRSTMRLFLLAEFEQAGGYHDVVMLATSMAAHGEISSRLAERLRYPRGFWDYFQQAASRTGVSPYLLLALTRQESLFDPAARSVADARGLMQLLPSTAQRVAAQVGVTYSEPDLYDPTVNIELGSANVKMLLEMFNGNDFRAIAAYNAGEDAVRRWNAEYAGPDDEWVENIGYAETRNYVKKVIGGMREYRMLYPPPRPQTAAVQ